jgi:hypothetical protein
MKLIYSLIFLNLFLIALLLLSKNKKLLGGEESPNVLDQMLFTSDTPDTQEICKKENDKIKDLEEQLISIEHDNIIEKVNDMKEWCKSNFDKILNNQKESLDDIRMICSNF